MNVPPGSGVQVDTPLEEPFTAFNNTGISYTTYIDYARGRLLLHTLKINPATSVVAVDRSPINSFLARKCQSPYTESDALIDRGVQDATRNGKPSRRARDDQLHLVGSLYR